MTPTNRCMNYGRVMEVALRKTERPCTMHMRTGMIYLEASRNRDMASPDALRETPKAHGTLDDPRSRHRSAGRGAGIPSTSIASRRPGERMAQATTKGRRPRGDKPMLEGEA